MFCSWKHKTCFSSLTRQWTPLIAATSGPVLSGHSHRWRLYPPVHLVLMWILWHDFSGHYNRLALISVDIISGVYFTLLDIIPFDMSESISIEQHFCCFSSTFEFFDLHFSPIFLFLSWRLSIYIKLNIDNIYSLYYRVIQRHWINCITLIHIKKWSLMSKVNQGKGAIFTLQWSPDLTNHSGPSYLFVKPGYSLNPKFLWSKKYLRSNINSLNLDDSFKPNSLNPASTVPMVLGSNLYSAPKLLNFKIELSHATTRRRTTILIICWAWAAKKSQFLPKKC